MLKLSFYGGLSEIGGNKILIEDKKNDARIFLDFGMSFSRRGAYFEEFLNPRTSSGLKDFLAMGLVPDIPGIYRNDLLAMAGLSEQKEPELDAVILSHAHQDHASYVSFLREEIPIYCSGGTHSYLRAMQECGKAGMESEIVSFKRRPVERGEEPVMRKFHTEKQKVRVNGLEIELVPVDHSISGACAAIIYGSDRTVVYSGDLRLHGTQGKLTTGFLESAPKAGADLLLMEGTRIGERREGESEQSVRKEALQVAKNASGLVIADFAYKDLTRLKTFWEVARETGRRLLISTKDAHLLNALSGMVPGIPTPKDREIAVYVKKKRSGKGEESDYRTWERGFLAYPNAVDSEYVRGHQGELVAHLTYFEFPELVDIRPQKGSAYVHSLSEPYNEEMKLDMRRLKNWLAHFGLKYNHAHCSGHAPQGDLVKIVQEIAPKAITPIHTEKPGMWKRLVKVKIERAREEKGEDRGSGPVRIRLGNRPKRVAIEKAVEA